MNLYSSLSNRSPFNYQKVAVIDRDVVTPWLTLAELRQQINLFDDTSQDTFLRGLETAVRRHIENYLGVDFIASTYQAFYSADSIFSPAVFDIPVAGDIKIDYLGYWNLDNVLTTVDSSKYYFDETGNKVIASTIPDNISNDRTNPIIIQYTTIPSNCMDDPVVIQAGLLLFTHLYNNRSNTTESNLRNIPFGFDTLLRSAKPLVM